MKTFNSSFAVIDDMDLMTLADLISVYEKINADADDKQVFIDDIF